MIRSVDIRAVQNLHVTQVHSTALSTQKLLELAPDDMPQLITPLDKVRTIVATEVANANQVLVVMPKKLEEALRQRGEITVREGVPHWRGAEVAHFRAIRGKDRWREFDTIVVVGRNELPGTAIDGYVRAHCSVGPKRRELVGNRELDGVDRGYRLADGRELGVNAAAHADPIGQSVLEQFREAETVHAIGRLRSVHAETTKRAIILSNIPIDITVDRLCTLDELAGTTARDRTLSRLKEALDRGGVLPLGARDLAQAYPDLFPKEWQAKDALKTVGGTPWLARCPSAHSGGEASQGHNSARNGLDPTHAGGDRPCDDIGHLAGDDHQRAGAVNGGENHIKALFGNSPHLRLATYRRVGQPGKPSRAIIYTDIHRDPETALSRWLGCELAHFELQAIPTEPEA